MSEDEITEPITMGDFEESINRIKPSVRGED